MEAKEADFEQKQNAYFAGQCTDKQLTEDTTQPFYESMRLSRKRLEERNLTVDVQAEEDRSGGRFAMFVDAEMYQGPYKDGGDYVGMHRRGLKIKRTFYRNGKSFAGRRTMKYPESSFEIRCGRGYGGMPQLRTYG